MTVRSTIRSAITGNFLDCIAVERLGHYTTNNGRVVFVYRNGKTYVAKGYGKTIGELYYYFCSDDKLLEINKQRLGHDFYTDIVTFPLTDCETVLSSEFCISVDRIKENAETFGRSYESELHRVIIHGVLHLIGFDDHTDEDEKEIRNQEEKCLELYMTMTTDNDHDQNRVQTGS